MAKTPLQKTKAGSVVTIVLGVIIIFFIGSEYRAYQLRKAIKNVFNTEVTEPKRNTNIVEKKLGEEFELATMKVKTNGIEEKQTINIPYSTPVIAKENAKFIVLNLDITNITKDGFVFDAAGMVLEDNQGRIFQSYGQYIALDNYLVYKQLSPNIIQNGVLVYELPNDATSYSLEINKGGTNDRYMVKLK